MDTPYPHIGAAITLAVTAFVFLKGDEPERLGGGAVVLAFLGSLLVQDHGRPYGSQWGVMLIEGVLLGVFAALIWKSGRTWAVWAATCQGLVLTPHLLTLVDLRPAMFASYVIAGLASYGVLLALVGGGLTAWRSRRAAGFK